MNIKHKIIILPTSDIIKGMVTKSDEGNFFGLLDDAGLANMLKSDTPQHIYFVTKKGIAVNDIVECCGKIGKLTFDPASSTYDLNCFADGKIYPYSTRVYFNKIVATTNPSLNLPGIPADWIKNEFLPTNGKLKEVELHFYQAHSNEACAIECKEDFYQLSVTKKENEVLVVTSTKQYDRYGEELSHCELPVVEKPIVLGENGNKILDHLKNKKIDLQGKVNIKAGDLNTMNFTVLVYAGIFVDENLLNKGIYTTGKPRLHDKGMIIEKLVEEAEKIKQMIPTIIGDKYIEGLKQCTLVPVELKMIV